MTDETTLYGYSAHVYSRDEIAAEGWPLVDFLRIGVDCYLAREDLWLCAACGLPIVSAEPPLADDFDDYYHDEACLRDRLARAHVDGRDDLPT